MSGHHVQTFMTALGSVSFLSSVSFGQSFGLGSNKEKRVITLTSNQQINSTVTQIHSVKFGLEHFGVYHHNQL